MRAVQRLWFAAFAVGLWLAPLPALAQDAAAQSDPPPSDSVGPRDLQNFSINGTVTRPAEPVSAPRPTSRAAAPTQRPDRVTTPVAPATRASTSSSTAERTADRPAATTRTAESRPPTEVVPEPTPRRSATPALSSTVTAQLPPISDSPVSSSDGIAEPAETLTGEHRLLLWPWLLAALALGAGGAFLFWRNRSREALAGGPHFDAFMAPEPQPLPPRAAPVPPPVPKAPPAPPAGIVSTRLRPWVELLFEPGRFIVENDKVTLEFELGLQNSGNAPARAVLAEASLLNAGPDQDQEVSAFFGAPVGEGERIAVIPPLKTIRVKTRVSAPLASVQLIEIGGRQVFVPLIAFNALYSWGSSEGQTSASYLLGRDTKGEKLAPFRLDLGPRIVRSVAARQLPIAVRK
jgi:hypothetical protein